MPKIVMVTYDASGTIAEFDVNGFTAEQLAQLSVVADPLSKVVPTGARFEVRDAPRVERVGPGNSDNDYLYVLGSDGTGYKFAPSVWRHAQLRYNNHVTPRYLDDDIWSPTWLCQHQHLNEDGICRRCGQDCRGG